MSSDNGGPAFPHVKIPRPGLGIGVVETFTDGGMTLRDWFAGQALAGLLAAWDENDEERLRDRTRAEKEQIVAKIAFRLSDAMLAERSKERG